MNYQPYADFDNIPLQYKKRSPYDIGQGINQLGVKTMTISDLSRNALFLKKDNPVNNDLIIKTALTNLQVDSPLSKIFYSDKNIKRLQNMIKNEIYIRSKGKYKMVVDQDQRQLLIVMSGIYKENAVYMPGKIVHQVKKLNNLVIDEVIPGMLLRINFDQKYLKDISEPINPIALPVNVSNAGRNALPSITTVWR